MLAETGLLNGRPATSHWGFERLFRTLKEQAIWGRTFRDVAEVRAAVAGFVARDNAEWRLERLGYLSPLAYRAQQLEVGNRAA